MSKNHFNIDSLSYISDLNENDELSNIKAKRRKSQMESLKKRVSTQFNESKTFIENYQLNLEFNLNLSIFADKKTVELKNSDKITIDLNNLKSFAHLLEADNHRIKGRIVYLQNDYAKIARNLADFERTSHESLSLSKNFSTLQIKQLELKIAEFREKTMKIKEEIIEIKSNTKLIKISEMEDELKYYTEETIKINNIIHKFTRSDFDSNEMTYIETNNLKESLLKQKKQIENDLEIIKKEIKEIQEKTKVQRSKKNDYQSKIDEIKSKISELLPILKIKSEEIENLKHRRNELARKTQIKSDEQTKVEALLNSEEKLKSIMGEKDHTITQQEKLINDLKKRFQEKNKAELNEKNALQEENNRLRENILELNEKISALDKLPLDRKKYDGDKIKKNDRESLKDKIVHREERRLKLVKKVKLEDIQKTVYEIRLRLILKNIALNNIDKYLLTEKLLVLGNATISDMKEILQKNPFNVINENESLLIARYLIEDNYYENIDLNIDRSNDVETIKIVFRKMIGNYQFIDKQSEEKLKSEVIFYVSRYGSLIRKNIGETTNRQGLITYLDVSDIFNQALATEKKILTNKQLDYIVLKLFEQSNDLNNLNSHNLFSIFKKTLN